MVWTFSEDGSARRVFSPNPESTVWCFWSFFVSGHTDRHGHGKRQFGRAAKRAATVRGAGKKRARSLSDRARPL